MPLPFPGTTLRVVSTRLPQDDVEAMSPAELAHERLKLAARNGYDQGYIAGERAGNLHRDRAFDCGVGVGAICGLAIGIVLTVFLAPIFAAVLS